MNDKRLVWVIYEMICEKCNDMVEVRRAKRHIDNWTFMIGGECPRCGGNTYSGAIRKEKVTSNE